MHHRRPSPAGGHGTRHQEGSLNAVEFVGSFPTADFTLKPAGPEVGFLGRSNVGKSSLINALVGRRALARTSKSPGKTRECNVYRVGEHAYLVDLPGYGFARVSKGERRRFGRLIDAYLSERAAVRGAVWLLDLRRDPSPEDLALGERLADLEMPLLIGLTKGDKIPRGRRRERTGAVLEAVGVPPDQAVVTSTVTGEGITDLRDSIQALLADD